MRILFFSGVLSAAFAPSMVLVATLVVKQPEMIILLVGAAFLWLCAMTVVSIVWTVLVPFRGMLWLLVLYAVVLQEVCRWGTYNLYTRLLRGLRAAGLRPTPARRTAEGAEMMPAAISSGLGAGLMQAIVMYGDVFGSALRPGTLHTPACSALTTFAVDALQCLGFQLLHVLLCIIGWAAAYPQRSWPMHGTILLLHYLASGATLVNATLLLPTGMGCAAALSCLLAVVLVAVGLTAHLATRHVCVAASKCSGHASTAASVRSRADAADVSRM